jgi:PPK2 family polyphosphate:nucleotide phosphotransferase
MSQPLKVKPGTKVRLADFSSDFHESLDKADGVAEGAKHAAALDELAYRLYAEHRRALLVVLQGMDTSGKDGTIRHVMSGVSPQTCKVVSFKQPNSEELERDFLWRVHRAVPPKGQIGIFNRSHYEDVLVARVHELVEKSEWNSRFAKINEFEKYLTQEGTTILKFFLHVSRDEQRDRLHRRIEDPHRRWKISEADVAERRFWDDYQRAYEDALTQCSTDCAPWFIVPADHKWYRNLVVSRIVHETLLKMDPKFPSPKVDLAKLVVE